VKLFFDVKFNNSNMSGAFRERKTEKNKISVDFVYAVFFEPNSKEVKETVVSNTQLLIKTRWRKLYRLKF